MIWSPQIDLEKCTACADCVRICPTQALALRGQKAHVIAAACCNYCGLCEQVCPAQAIQLPYLICFATDKPIKVKEC